MRKTIFSLIKGKKILKGIKNYWSGSGDENKIAYATNKHIAKSLLGNTQSDSETCWGNQGPNSYQ